ncbi:MAG: hypothetical protein IBX63_11390 [Coriobacteriia bacterium]|nr:hypothetical protein [Coriobacteriia bacterium]
MEGNRQPADDINWNHAMYALEKLSESVHILVTGEGDARSRIRTASRYFFRVSPSWLPPVGEIRERFETAISLLTKYPAPSWNDDLREDLRYTDFTYTMTRIKNVTAARAASELYCAWLELSRVYDEHSRECSAAALREGSHTVFIDDIP